MELIIRFLKRIKRILLVIRETLTELIFWGRTVILVGYPYSRNFGDAFGVTLVKELTGKVIVFNHFSAFKLFDRWLSRKKYAVVGSIIDHCDGETIVWGAGCLSVRDLPKTHPKEIRAVRGPNTRQLLLEQGIGCPEVYGDPALFLPALYSPTVPKKYDLGIIPHYLDKPLAIVNMLEEQGVKVIDIDVRHNWKAFVDDVLSCRNILSSSLHGLIVAEVYGIPTHWIQMSGNVEGDGFKFRDYYNSIGIRDDQINVHVITPADSVSMLVQICTQKSVGINLDPLIECSPFPFTDILKSKL